MKPTEFPHYQPNYEVQPPRRGFTLVNSTRRLAGSNDSSSAREGGTANSGRPRSPQERRQHLIQILESAIAIIDDDEVMEENLSAMGREHRGGESDADDASSPLPPGN